MLGYYNYTVFLTYLSLISAGTGIFVSLSGKGHPFLGIFFLLLCGLCDAFDGKVARTKKDRSETECKFGIQIDSLSDIVAFGVLPACIGGAMIRCSPSISALREVVPPLVGKLIEFFLFSILILYVLAAMIRLAYFNVTEEERQQTEDGCRKTYTGLPVTSASLIFPTVLLIQYLVPTDLTVLYFAVMILTGFAFLARFRMKKPGTKEIVIMVIIGALEYAAMCILRHFIGK